MALHLGSITGSIKVLEMSDGAKEVCKRKRYSREFSQGQPAGGMPFGTDYKIYQGTLDLFTTQLSKRLYSHIADDEPGTLPP